MKKQLANIILTSIGLTILVAYLIWSIYIIPDKRPATPCKDIRVYVADSTSRQFIRTNEILAMLKQNKIFPQSVTQEHLDAGAIEDLIASHNLIKSAQCFTTPDGDIIIRLKQKEPKYRVIGTNGDYFVDKERSLMKVTTRTASYVPVITGSISQEFATGEMFDFINFLEQNTFWNNQIEQIIVIDDKTIKLVPRIGSHTIILGTLDCYEQKLDKLETLYVKGFNKNIGWKHYKEIDLRYEGQIVCR